MSGFRFYFATDPGEYQTYKAQLQGEDIAIPATALMGEGATELAKALSEHRGNVLLTSGSFANFNEPGAVSFDDWRETVEAHKSLVAEVIGFDDMRNPEATAEMHKAAVEAGLDPIVMDHLWFEGPSEYVAKAKVPHKRLGITGFSRGKDARGRFRSRYAKVDKGTTFHVSEVEDFKPLLPFMDKIASVDSSSWDSAAKAGGFVAFGYEDAGGTRVPVLRAFPAPEEAPTEIREKAWDQVVEANGWQREAPVRKAKLVSLYHAKKYARALRKFDPSALKGEAVAKALDAGGAFELPDMNPLDPSTPSAEVSLLKAQPTDEGLESFEMEKDRSPWLDAPEDSEYRYTTHAHYVGKSAETEVRFSRNSATMVQGWSLNSQQGGSLGEAVQSLGEARAIAKSFGDAGIADWNAWERGQSLRAVQKAVEPISLLDLEGANAHEVRHIVDKGVMEYGAQRRNFHEYFLRNERVAKCIFFHKHEVELEKAQASHSKCMKCEKEGPELDVLWANGRGRAWFHKGCFPKWKKDVGEWAEIVSVKAIKGGVAPPKFSDIHKHFGSDEVDVAKARVNDGPDVWVAGVAPNVPFVLTKHAGEWMPPEGRSALPGFVRDQIPPQFRYWEAEGIGAVQKRAALAKAIEGGKLTINFDVPPLEVEKRSHEVAKFSWQRHEWSDTTEDFVRLDMGDGYVVALKMHSDPVENEVVAADLVLEPHVEAVGFAGLAKGAHYMNARKRGSCNVRKLDEGEACVTKWDAASGELEVTLLGKQLEGQFATSRSDDGELRWTLKQAGEGIADKATVSKTYQLPVTKVDSDKRLVTGIVLEPDEVDAQNDTITKEVIEKAAHKFLSAYNEATRMGLMHKIFGSIGVDLVESWLAPSDLKIGGQKVKEGSWIMTVKVQSNDLWQKVKRGEITGFSIGGVATVA
jgi:hypothetical protein